MEKLRGGGGAPALQVEVDWWSSIYRARIILYA